MRTARRPGTIVRGLIAGVLLAAGLGLAGLEWQEPATGYRLDREAAATAQADGWLIERVRPGSISHDAGLRAGDRLLAVDDLPVAPTDDRWLAGGRRLTVARVGRVHEVRLDEHQAAAAAARVALVLAGLLFLLTGGFTWWRGGDGRAQVAFLLLCAAAGLGLIVVPMGARGYVWAQILVSVSSTAALTALAVFCRRFPRDLPMRLAGRVVPPESLWLGMLALEASGVVARLVLADGGVLTDLLGNLWLVGMLGFVCLSLARGWAAARRAGEARGQTQLRIIGAGTLLGFLPLLLVLLPRLLWGAYPVDPALVLPLMALLPLAVAYAMLRYRIMDVDLVVRRGAVWALFAMLSVGLLIGAHEVSELVTGDDDRLLKNGLLGLAGLVIFLLLTWVTRHLDQVVYGRDYNARRILAETARDLTSTLDEATITTLALGRIVATLQPSVAVLYERPRDDGAARPVAWRRRHESGEPTAAPAPLPREHPGLAALVTDPSWQGGVGECGEAGPAGIDAGRPAALVAVRGGEAEWVLGLTPRPSGLPYARGDIDLVVALAHGLAAALINARQYARLRASEERYRTLTRHFPNGLVTLVDRDLRLSLIDGAALPTLGLRPDLLEGRPVDEIVAPEARALVRAAHRQALAGQAVTIEVPYQERLLEMQVIPIGDQHGEVTAALALAQDVTARRRADATRSLLAEASDALAGSLDYATTLTRVVQFAVPLLADYCFIDVLDEYGLPRRLAIAHADPTRSPLVAQLARFPSDLAHPRGQAARVLLTGQVVLEPVIDATVRDRMAQSPEHRHLLEALGPTACLSVPLAARGRVLGALTCCRTSLGGRYTPEDVALVEELARRAAQAIDNARLYNAAELARGQAEAALAQVRESQAQLVHAARLATIGEVAASVAHELNQPLMVLRGRIQQLLADADGAEPLRTRLQRLEAQTDKMAGIITYMRSFARREAQAARPVSLNQVVNDALILVREQLAERGIAVVLDLLADLPLVRGDAGQLEQVVLNLLTNARDVLAGRPDGRITLTTRREDAAWVVLRVADNGPGIPAAERERVFESFFTTKPAGEGTGLGLSISRTIVANHGGHLDVESLSGQGATFRLVVPTMADQPLIAA